MSDRKRRNLINALAQIKFIAGMHYLGGAFDPEHMRSLANIAADALAGKDFPPMPNREKLQREAKLAADLYAGYVDDGADFTHQECECRHPWTEHEVNPTTPDWMHCTRCKHSCMVD